jgi:DNA-binding CsgD family transcriptional regulator
MVNCSIKDSSDILNISKKTLEAYRMNLKNKLGVHSKRHIFDLINTCGKLNIFIRIANDLFQRQRNI